MRVFLIDNYDSFTYNLVHQLEQLLNAPVTVKRNDAFELSELDGFDVLVVSPGPGIPDEAGLTKQALEYAIPRMPVLGVCLGHQALGEVLGASLKNLATVHHGVDCELSLSTDDPLFAGLNLPLRVGRYHSWVIDPSTLPSTLEILATDSEGEIMAVRHTEFPVYGVQFHPESVLTPQGPELLANFLHLSSLLV